MEKHKRILQFARGTGIPAGFTGQSAEFSEAVLATLRVSDPAITDLVLGYKNQNMIRQFIFPEFPVEKEAGKLPGVGREGLQQWNLHRALQGKSNHMEFKTGSVSFELEEDSIGFMIDDREAEEWAVTRDSLIAIRQRAVNTAIDIGQELGAATLVNTAGNYAAGAANSGAAFNWAGSGDPVKDWFTYIREPIRQQIGAYPNRAVFDPSGWKLFRTNEAVRAYASKYVSPGGPTAVIITEQLAAIILEVEQVIVGRSVYVTSAAAGFGDTVTTADIWGVVQTSNLAGFYSAVGIEEPTFGLKFIKRNYPQATSYRWEPQHSDVYETQHIYQQKITLKEAGALIYSIA